MSIIRILHDGQIVPTGSVSIGPDGNLLVSQGDEDARQYRVEWDGLSGAHILDATAIAVSCAVSLTVDGDGLEFTLSDAKHDAKVRLVMTYGAQVRVLRFTVNRPCVEVDDYRVLGEVA